MDNRKKIEEILLNDYGCFDDFTVDKLCVLFSVSITEGKLCEICECNDATLITEHCQNCDEYIINGEHN